MNPTNKKTVLSHFRSLRDIDLNARKSKIVQLAKTTVKWQNLGTVGKSALAFIDKATGLLKGVSLSTAMEKSFCAALMKKLP